jgi:para-nitrobenzyl esterase
MRGARVADPVVGTRYGSIRGGDSDGIAAFLGIPYAAPPTHSRRFSPPVEPEPWSGVRDARSVGPIAPQPESLLGGYVPGDPRVQDEECLSLNVYTPRCDDARRPVLVFIHGGAFLIGTGGSAMYRAEALARRDVVVVTFNYRLGALGFLAHPNLARSPGEPFANWGVLDQLAALRFVRDHVADFGGDPQNVTIFGESAGAMSAANLLAVPSAKGLFRRAILQSGAALALGASDAARVAERFAGALGFDRVDRDLLAAVPTADLLAAQATLLGDLGVGASMPFQPVVDGTLLPDHPAVALAAGGGNAEALLIGTNRDEFRFFTIGKRQLDGVGDDALVPYVEPYLPPDRSSESDVVVKQYREIASGRGEAPTARGLFESIAADAVFWAPAMRLASASSRCRPTFVYRFDWESPFMGGSLGACHGLELPFVFGTTANPIIGLFSGSGPDAEELSATIQSAWVAFATDGEPGAGWPRYDESSRSTAVLGGERLAISAPREPERIVWESLLGQYGDADS